MLQPGIFSGGPRLLGHGVRGGACSNRLFIVLIHSKPGAFDLLVHGTLKRLCYLFMGVTEAGHKCSALSHF